MPTAAEETEYGARFSLRTPGAADTLQIREQASSPTLEQNNQDQGTSNEEAADARNESQEANVQAPPNWSNVMQQSVRMDRRSTTEHSNIPKSG